MIQRFFPMLLNGLNIQRVGCSVPIAAQLIHQVNTVFIAHKKNDSSYLEKVTGYESDISIRKGITETFKAEGMKWDPIAKAWVPTTNVSFEKINQVIQGGLLKESVVSTPRESSDSPYASRIESLLKKWDENLSALLPRHVSKQQFLESLRMALFQAKKTGSSSADEALYTACCRCAQLGMTPGPLNEVYFSSREGQVEFLLGYKGIIALARRAIPEIQIEANVVREGDEFTYVLGTSPTVNLKQGEDCSTENITHAYVQVRFPDGTSKLTVVDQEHIIKRMNCSKGANAPSSPWKKFPREMWLKTAIRDAFRFINLSPETLSKGDQELDKDFVARLVKTLQAELDAKETDS